MKILIVHDLKLQVTKIVFLLNDNIHFQFPIPKQNICLQMKQKIKFQISNQ